MGRGTGQRGWGFNEWAWCMQMRVALLQGEWAWPKGWPWWWGGRGLVKQEGGRGVEKGRG